MNTSTLNLTSTLVTSSWQKTRGYMCGIVYQQNFDETPVNNDVLQAFDNQRHRGTEGFGLFTVYSDGTPNLVRSANEDKVLNYVVKHDMEMMMFHHRKPTSTKNVKRAAHPFSTKDHFGDNQYVLIHNGSINNSWALHQDHEDMGIAYQSQLDKHTFNDSEALLWDFALTMEGEQEELKARGLIAFICMRLHKGKPDKLFFGRNTYPLKMLRDKKKFNLASEGEGEDIKSDTLYTYNYELNRLTKKDFTVPSKYQPVETNHSNRSWNWQNEQYGTESKFLTQAIQGALGYGDQEVLYWRDDGTPVYEADVEYENMDDYWDHQEMQQSFDSVDTDEVLKRAMDYLDGSMGVFETAYWFIEQEYEELMDFAGAKEVDKELNMLERIMEFITQDPEYKDEKSVSSLWKGLQCRS